MSFPENPTCQHRLVDNDTGHCRACGEQMVTRHTEAETVLSAPNANPCRDPEHLAAIAAGKHFECHQPYIPDRSREQLVIVGWRVWFDCQRCAANADTLTFDASTTTWPCGGQHEGDYMAAAS